MKNMQKKCNKCKRGNLKRQCPFAVMPAAAAPSHENKEAPFTVNRTRTAGDPGYAVKSLMAGTRITGRLTGIRGLESNCANLIKGLGVS